MGTEDFISDLLLDDGEKCPTISKIKSEDYSNKSLKKETALKELVLIFHEGNDDDKIRICLVSRYIFYY